MRIYIASSWKNQHAVELLTELLRNDGHTIISFVEKSERGEKKARDKFDAEKWINSKDGRKKFKYDTDGATTNDLVIYVGPSGTDAWAEVGAAWASRVPVLGLHAKGEPGGLMRHMVKWFRNFRELMREVEAIDSNLLSERITRQE
jgi:hypothetical protein